MKKHSDPISTIIDFALTKGADLFWVNNAKDQLKRFENQTEQLKNSLSSPVAWAKTNALGDLYDLRLQNNPYDDQTIIVPLYRISNV